MKTQKEISEQALKMLPPLGSKELNDLFNLYFGGSKQQPNKHPINEKA